MAQVTTIRYQDLLNPATDLTADIERAFGPEGLGILTVSGIPGYAAARSKLLLLSAQFANLPDEVKQQYEDAKSKYSVGWSHGKEFLRPGKPDVYKGSYYANPLFDNCTPVATKLHGDGPKPSCFPANVWPTADLPELEFAFKHLGKMIIDAGLLIAQRCDRYVCTHNTNIKPGSIYRTLQRSRTPIARLLHYFPPNMHRNDDQSDWCSWHTDHGSLTGLTSAMYIKDGRPVPNPDPESGLYICDQHGDVVKAAIPADHVAFQLGEALQIACGGLLRATPHYVRAAYGPAAESISRNTFAVFMQPDTDEVMEPPQGCTDTTLQCISQWTRGVTFGQFHKATLRKYYGTDLGSDATGRLHPQTVK